MHNSKMKQVIKISSTTFFIILTVLFIYINRNFRFRLPLMDKSRVVIIVDYSHCCEWCVVLFLNFLSFSLRQSAKLHISIF